MLDTAPNATVSRPLLADCPRSDVKLDIHAKDVVEFSFQIHRQHGFRGRRIPADRALRVTNTCVLDGSSLP